MSTPDLPTTTLRLAPYSPAHEAEWNDFVDRAANGTFLLRRSFMDYHQDRFADASLLVWQREVLVAVFVAGQYRQTPEPAVLVAHPGLTYGGLIHLPELKYADLAAIYPAVLEQVRAAGYRQLVIKPVPRVFCRFPNEASLFWLTSQGFALRNREQNSVIDLLQPLRISKGRKDNVRKARKQGIEVAVSGELAAFWDILTDNLWATHQVRPVHSLAEISLLQERHPANVVLYTACLRGEVVAGVLLFVDEARGFVHTQYISANETGKATGAVDAVLLTILEHYHQRVPRFSFGISTVRGVVNFGLLAHKEGFGATVELMDTYAKEL
ncbi:hypothetical protein [Hymenobacter sp. B81]|uniref:hypothetical protein n=1 Tax=Hymenobacter sp. B81 TaxID=3344878 RepID=UPI0037DD1041